MYIHIYGHLLRHARQGSEASKISRRVKTTPSLVLPFSLILSLSR